MNVMGMCSPDELRAVLQKGFNELLQALPEGKEPTLKVARDFRNGFLITDNTRTALSILLAVAGTTSAFSERFTEDVVKGIMVKEGGVRAILAGDEGHIAYLVQRYLD